LNDTLNRIYLLFLKVFFFCGATAQIEIGSRVF